MLGAGTNYFVSGTYYFAFNGALDLSSKGTGGGWAPGTNEATVLANGNPCVQETTAMGAEGGTGVLFILGGSSTLQTTVAATDVELYARRARGARSTVPASSPCPPAAFPPATRRGRGHGTDRGDISNWSSTGRYGRPAVRSASACRHTNSRLQAYGGCRHHRRPLRRGHRPPSTPAWATAP